MATLKKMINISGKTLMSGQESSVTLFPSKEKGIRFFVRGSQQPIEAIPSNVISTDNCVVLGNTKSQIMLVEHFMAACAFAGIDSLDVSVASSEMPVFDGSSLKWYEQFVLTGIEEEEIKKGL